MPEPRVITFEKDIEEEIRSKAASLSDIASASGFVTNKPVAKESRPTVFLLLSVIMLLVLAGIGGAFYYLYLIKPQKVAVTTQVAQTKTTAPQTETTPKKGEGVSSTTPSTQTPTTSKTVDRESGPVKRLVKKPFAELFPLTSPFIESQITKTETVSDSYIISFNGYSEMFKKVNDHENLLYEDLVSLFSETGSTTLPLTNSSSTTLFKDVRLGNIDARELSLPNQTQKVYYSFVKPSTIIISADKKTLEQLAGDILK